MPGSVVQIAARPVAVDSTITQDGNVTNTVTWGAWTVQYVNSGTTATATVVNKDWVIWNQQTAYQAQQAIHAASRSIQTMGTSVNDCTNITWGAWNSQTIITSGAATSNFTVWDTWNDAALRNASSAQVRRAVERRQPSEEEVRARQEQEKKWRETEEKRKKDEIEAKAKAELLLRQHLSDEQKEDLEKKGCFFLFVGEEKYQIARGQHGNVKLLDKDGKVRRSFCIQPRIQVPDADAMLAQKLMLETDRESFHRIANITEYGGRAEPVRPAPVANRI